MEHGQLELLLVGEAFGIAEEPVLELPYSDGLVEAVVSHLVAFFFDLSVALTVEVVGFERQVYKIVAETSKEPQDNQA